MADSIRKMNGKSLRYCRPKGVARQRHPIQTQGIQQISHGQRVVHIIGGLGYQVVAQPVARGIPSDYTVGCAQAVQSPAKVGRMRANAMQQHDSGRAFWARGTIR